MNRIVDFKYGLASTIQSITQNPRTGWPPAQLLMGHQGLTSAWIASITSQGYLRRLSMLDHEWNPREYQWLRIVRRNSENKIREIQG